MRLARTHDADYVNWVVNHPDVRPFVGAPEAGELDLSPIVERPEHWFLMGEHGGFGLLWTAPRTYEVHTFILRSGRGEWGNAARSEGIEFARQRGAKVLWTKIPPRAHHVERFARQGGMQPTGEVIETFGVPHRIFRMELN
jgi:hypothetical protein